MSVGAVRCLVVALALEGIIGLFDSCIHRGMKYGDGDYFLPNDTIIKTDGPRQCVQCSCRQGLVLCEIEDCPPLQCEVPVQKSHLCCSHCPDSGKGSEERSDLVIGTGQVELEAERNAAGDCLSNGKRLRNGSSWQPVMGPLGVMACVECRCQGGVIICGRQRCGRSLCPKPRRQLGQCCPVCPSPAEKRRKAFCVPKVNELLVFRTGNVRNGSERIEYAFLDTNPKSHFVSIHSWNLRTDTPTDVFTLYTVPRELFRHTHLQLLGSISRRRFGKYSRREKKLRRNCLAKCLAKMERLERSLVDYPVRTKSKCGEEEVDVGELRGEAWGMGEEAHEAAGRK